MSSKAATTTLRRILRCVKKNEASLGTNDMSKLVLEVARSRQGSAAVATSNTNALQSFADTYAKLLEDLQERKRLQELDTGAEVQLSPKEMSRRAAARAGLQLPDLNPELADDDYSSKN